MATVILPRPTTYTLTDRDLGSEWLCRLTGAVYVIGGWEAGRVTVSGLGKLWRSHVQHLIATAEWVPVDRTAGRLFEGRTI